MAAVAILPAVLERLARRLAVPAEPLVPLRVDGRPAGALTSARAERLAAMADVFRRDAGGLAFAPGLAGADARSRALDRVARALAAEGTLSAWRDERYDVRADDDGPVLFALERAAARYFGVATAAVHVNGLVRTSRGVSMWIARRSASKAIDPGLLDNLVGGGIASGMGIADTLVKEAAEEAGLAPAMAAQAQSVALLRIRRLAPDGLQDETIHAHDLWLPADWTPSTGDGEVAGHLRVPLDVVAALLARDDGPDAVTVDASLVALDALLRLGAIAPDDPQRAPLERLRDGRT